MSGALARAEAEVRDALERLRMARSDAGGENLALDSVEVAIEGEGATAAEVREGRASRIAESVAQSLEATADRLRDAAR